MTIFTTADILSATEAIGPGDSLRVMANTEHPLIDRNGHTLRYGTRSGAMLDNTIAAIMNRRPFMASTMSGGPASRGTGELTELYVKAYRAIWDDDSAYVVYSYLTPIAWYTDVTGWTVPITIYGATTSAHQRVARRAVRAVTPVAIVINSLEGLKIASHDTGGHFFSPAAMRCFSSVIHGDVEKVTDYEGYFITSEVYGDSYRAYRIRDYESGTWDDRNGVTLPRVWFSVTAREDGGDQAYDTLAEAQAALKALLATKS